MIIGIDASRALIKEKTGTENYSHHLIKNLLKIDKKNKYRLYCRPILPSATPGEGSRKRRSGIESASRSRIERIPDRKNSGSVKIAAAGGRLPGGGTKRVISWPRFWTQGGLALECLLRPPDLLFIPAHTLPVIRRPSLKTVVTIHGLEYEYLPQYYQFPQKLYLNKSTEYAVKHATHLIAVSQWTKNQLVSQLNADPKKISVVYEGIGVAPTPGESSSNTPGEVGIPRERSGKDDPGSKSSDDPGSKEFRIERVPDRKSSGSSRPYILFVGTVQPRKNLIRLIQAFSSLQVQGLALNLVIAGKFGWMYDEILAAPKKFGVEKNVKFLGYVDDQKLAQLYQGALFFILPSLCEGFGLPALEAMAYGCPVIAANAGALPEVVGKAGLLVNPKKTGEIIKAMKLMIENQALCEALREKGYQRIKQFSWEKTAQETVKIFERVYET